MIYNYIKDKYKEGEPIFFSDIYDGTISKPALTQQLATLCKKGLLVKYDNGIYKFTGKLFTKSNTVEVKSVDITLTSGSNSVTLHGYVDQEIEYGEEVDVIAYSDTDYSKYKASYKVNYITDEEPGNTEGSDTEGSGN